MDLREIGWGGMDWIDLDQDRDRWRGSREHGNELLGFMELVRRDIAVCLNA
jgi:hypothetical protein